MGETENKNDLGSYISKDKMGGRGGENLRARVVQLSTFYQTEICYTITNTENKPFMKSDSLFIATMLTSIQPLKYVVLIKHTVLSLILQYPFDSKAICWPYIH